MHLIRLLRLLLVFSLFAQSVELLATPSQDEAVPPVKVRVFTLEGTFADHPEPMGFDPMALLSGGADSGKSFYKLIEKIQEVAAADDIGHILFDLSAPDLNLNGPQLAELDRQMESLIASGKKTYAWIESAGNVHYSIASGCQKIFMADFASFDLPSMSMQTLHFRDALDLLGVRVDYTRVGDFKGAVEPYTLSESSEHLKEHYRMMLSSMNDAFVARLAKNRNVDSEIIRKIQASRLLSPTQAKESGLIDMILPYGVIRESLNALLGGKVQWVEVAQKKKEPISIFSLMNEILGQGVDEVIGENTIAVLHLNGEIVDGTNASPGSMVSGPSVEAIQELTENDAIKGVVVRINSPGGSATASEVIRRALKKLTDKKPVVLSMGDLAASGGYWITCLGKPIFAEAQTITGSIGVFALKFDASALLRRVGIHMDTIALDSSASMMAPYRDWSDEERSRLQEHVDEVYGRFLELVSESRRMSVEDVDKIAGGRVWSGGQALSLGLIDHIGGVDSAIASLAKTAKLSDFEIIHRPTPADPLEMLDLFGSNEEEIRALIVGPALGILSQAGFRLKTPLRLLLEEFKASRPRVLALSPAEFLIR